ncbi:MAG: 50S ribosomal protein L6 [Nitrospira sp.]|nr:50S ribosomal protein L6 [Nitrospira sp.]
MSRIGKNKIDLPQGVDVKVDQALVRVKGPKGQLELKVPPQLTVRLQDGHLFVDRKAEDNVIRALHGTIRNLIQNMVRGVTQGYTKVLEINGVGYRAQLQGRTLAFTLGFSHPVNFELPAGIEASVEKQTIVTLKGIDRYLVGQVASNIRRLRDPEPYKGKGIKYANEVIRRKQGKAGKAKA